MIKKYVVRFEYERNYKDDTDFHRLVLLELDNPFKDLYDLEKHLNVGYNDEISNKVYDEKFDFEIFKSIWEYDEGNDYYDTDNDE